MVCGESDEDWPIVFLDVRKTAAELDFGSISSGPRGRSTGSENRVRHIP